MESTRAKVRRLITEEIELTAYNPCWAEMFAREKNHLMACIPGELARRIEHFGSTAVPGLTAKPVIDMLIEVGSLEEAKKRIVPILIGQGYDYLWRPTWGDAGQPFYAWFIKRNDAGRRTHHLHMVEKEFPHWERLRFRDYLVRHPDEADKYGELKRGLVAKYPHDRVAYTKGKDLFIARVMAKIRAEAKKDRS
jgi:GrpB-like predicted nucleotidyltransferase (UPF0157 family)